MWRITANYWPFVMDAANENTKFLFVKDFRNVQWTIIASSSAACTIKFYVSNQEDRPDFDSVASATNQYSTVDVIYLWGANGWDSVAWDTGIVYTGAEDWQLVVEENNNGWNWIWIKMTARAAGTITAYLSCYDNR